MEVRKENMITNGYKWIHIYDDDDDDDDDVLVCLFIYLLIYLFIHLFIYWLCCLDYRFNLFGPT